MKARTLVTIGLLAGAAAWAQSTPPSQQVVADSKAQVQSTRTALSGAPAPARPTAKPSAAPKPSGVAAPKPPGVAAAKPSGVAAAKPSAVAAAKPQAQSRKAAAGAAAAPAAAKKPQVPPKKTALGGTLAAKPGPRKVAPAKKATLKTSAPAAKQEGPKPATANKRDPFVSPIREAGIAGPTCTTGKKCLAINTVDLKGIVVSQAGMIAVVESSVRKVTYFLRENDPVFNGYVVKITPDSIVFRENVVDRLGKQSTRDVVKRVAAPAV